MKSPIDIGAELAAIAARLLDQHVPFAVCGGFAVAVHGYVRATDDIDLLLEEQSVEPAFVALRALGYTLRAGPIPFSVGTPQERRLYRATKVHDGAHLSVDLMVVTPVFQDVWKTRQFFEWQKTQLPVVSRDGLVLMKRLARRRQDLTDLEHLGVDPDAEPR